MKPGRFSLFVGCILGLGACDLAPQYRAPVIVIPVSYKEAGPWQPAQPADGRPRGPWWKEFGDDTLDGLEAQVDTANPDLVAAEAAYAQARALAGEAEAGLYPNLDASGSLSANRQSADRPLRSSSQPTYYGANAIAAQASYEVDLWGRVRSAVTSGRAQAQASAAALESVRLILHAELANDYMLLRGLDAELKLLADTVVAYRRALELTRNREAGAIASGLDVARAETQLDTTKAQTSDVIARRAILEHAIARLAGQPASAFSLAPDATMIRLPDIPPGIPSSLLLRRPDIAAAERQAAAANALIGVAEAAFYPRLTLGLGGGFQATGLNLLSFPNSFWSVGPAISLPVFEGGLLRAQLAGVKAQFDAAAANYRATVLDAFREVEDNLARLHWLAQETKGPVRNQPLCLICC